MKYNIENKAVTESPPSKGAHSLINDAQLEQNGADSKSNKLEGKTPAMIAKSEVPKEMTSEGDGRMRNENGTLCTWARAIKKPNQYDNCKL